MYNIKAERVRRGIKQSVMAEKLGITPQYLCKIEKGEVEPRRNLMKKLSEELDTDVQELFFQD